MWWSLTQLEFTHAVGPANGLYPVARTDAPPTRAGEGDVLHLGYVGAPVPVGIGAGRLHARRRRKEPLDTIREVPLVIATFATAPGTSMPATDDAAAMMTTLRSDTALVDDLVHDAIAVLNVAIAAHRAATWDPYVVEVAREDARAVRVGIGDGEDVRAGRLRDGFDVPPPKAARSDRDNEIRPSEYVAQVLSGRAEVHDVHVHLARALLDLELDRFDCAASELRAAADRLRRVGVALPESGTESPEAIRALAEQLLRVADVARQNETDRTEEGK